MHIKIGIGLVEH